MTHPPRNGVGRPRKGSRKGPDEVPVSLDLLRADLYRLIDALVHAPAERHVRIIRRFERAWRRFKVLTARESSARRPAQGSDVASGPSSSAPDSPTSFP